MTSPKQDREKVFREELTKLNQRGLITDEVYDNVYFAYQEFVLENKEQEILKSQETSNKKVAKPKKTKQPKPVKEKSPEQIRERNITWSLILGVIFLLIGGLVLATSTWDQMGPFLKVISLSFVSLFFFGLSWVSSKFLKIEKTAFAFLTLGSLLIPIAVIAIGYFELLGPYLSLTGDGRYILGLIGTLLPLPIYIRNAHKHRSRLFVWISYLFLSFSVGFLIAALKVPIDLFYLLIMVFNGLLLYGYHRLQSNQKWTLFIKELPRYAQLNLIVSTLLMLFIFEEEIFYSFNILLTAAIYMAMVFVYNTKEYQFVFSVLFAYGAYQLIEYSPLDSIDLVVYAILGIIYVGFGIVTKKHSAISKVFHYISGVVSFFAFIYISYQGLVLRAGEDSFLLFLAYLIIAINYSYLTYITKRPLFAYLSSLFIMVTGLQLWDVLEGLMQTISVALFMFLYSGILFVVIGIWSNNKYLVPIKTSSYNVSILGMLLCMGYALLYPYYLQLSLMLGLFGGLALLVVSKKAKLEQKIAEWGNPLSWLFALLVIFPKITEWYTRYELHFDWPFHLAASGLILLAISMLWKKDQWKALSTTSFYVGQGAYLFGLLQIPNYSLNEDFLRPLLLFIGIGVFTWMVRRAKKNILWLLVALNVFVFYASLLTPFRIESFEGTVTYLLFGVVLLLVVDYLVGKKEPKVKPYFFWLAHAIQAGLILLILFDQIFTKSVHPWVLFIPLFIYLYSFLTKEKEWQIKLHLYLAMSMIPLLIATLVPYYNWLENIPIVYCWLVSSALFALVWLGVNTKWQSRLEWYLIPFSVLGLYTMVMEGQSSSWEVIPILCYVLLNLFFLHKRKWTIGTVLPLFMTLILWEQLRYVFEDQTLLLISVASFGILISAGRLLHDQFYKKQNSQPELDGYSIVALFYVVFAQSFINGEDLIWIQVIPFVLFTVWAFSQVSRFHRPMVKRVLKTIGGISILPTYFNIFEEYKGSIPELFHAEIIVLPILVLSIVLSVTTWSSYKKIMNYVQFIILILVTSYLVLDAIQSHTIWDALIIGTLSLASMLIGMQLRIKSYFLVGTGTLIFNVMYQTKPYWGNMPWWAYLLITGAILITIASINEWKKQTGKESKLLKKMKDLWVSFRKWD